MRRLACYAPGACLIAALLAGCGMPTLGPQSSAPAEAPLSTPHGSPHSPWLYVSDDPFSIGVVYLLAFPNGNKVKAIERIGYAYGPCADSSGHVWIPARGNRAVVLEFRAGKTKAIGRLDLPRQTGLGECAVDSVTGDLAVLGTHSVNIFTHAKGKSTNYALGTAYVTAAAYDPGGNLFVDGMKPISTSRSSFVLYELPKGDKAFAPVTLDKRAGVAGGLIWDGQYLAVANGGDGVKPVIYRFSVSGSKGTVVQAVHPDGLNYHAWFAVANGEVVGTSGLYGPKIRLWPYPAGGKWIWEMPGLQTQGMAIVNGIVR